MVVDNRFNRNIVRFSLILLVCATIVFSAEDCWWTECQPNALAATGCDDYSRTEKAREACDHGFKYHCCATDEPTEEILLDDHCWWSECGPKDLTDRGCPSHSVRQSQTRACAEGDGNQYLCCMENYHDDLKMSDRHKSVAGNEHRASDPEYRNSGREQKKAGEIKSDTESSGNTTKHVLSGYRAGVKTESQGRRALSRRNRNAHRVDDRQTPVYADRDDAVSAGDGGRPDGDGPEAPDRMCDGEKRLVGYYTSWSPDEMSGRMMKQFTHVVYSFLIPQADGTVDFDSPASRERLLRLMELRRSYPHVKIMFAVGGGSSSQHFSAIAASSDVRRTFADSIVRLTGDNGFDGVDIDWEFPAVTGALGGAPEDKDNYVLLMKEVREALDAQAAETGRAQPYVVSFAGPAGQWALDPGFDLPALLEHADFVNVMAYDYFGVWPGSAWSEYTGPPAPLYAGTPPGFPVDFGRSSADWTFEYYARATGDRPDRLNLGVPFYGWYWENVGDAIDAADPMWRTARPVDGQYRGGATPWRRILEDHLSDPRFRRAFHPRCQTPYAWNADARVFLGYEDARSLGYKARYAASKGAGGLMVWAVDMDDDDLTLTTALVRATACPSRASGLVDVNRSTTVYCIVTIILRFIVAFV